MDELSNTLNPKLTAKYLGVSKASLRLWRSEDRGPVYFRAGTKLIRYRRSDLDAWIEQHLSRPTESTATK
jgi:predicted DNA-binding transcriptional regulator AlpA